MGKNQYNNCVCKTTDKHIGMVVVPGQSHDGAKKLYVTDASNGDRWWKFRHWSDDLSDDGEETGPPAFYCLYDPERTGRCFVWLSRCLVPDDFKNSQVQCGDIPEGCEDILDPEKKQFKGVEGAKAKKDTSGKER